MATITVYLSEEDEDLKKMLKDLKAYRGNHNPYYGLSESKIAGRVLSRFLPDERRRVMGDDEPAGTDV